MAERVGLPLAMPECAARFFQISLQAKDAFKPMARGADFLSLPETANTPTQMNWAGVLAERVGFEPTEPFGSPVFKTGAIDHSTTSPEDA